MYQLARILILTNNNKINSMKGIEMDSTNSDKSFKTSNVLCEKVNSAEVIAKGQLVDTKLIDAAWSTQPSLEQDFALHGLNN